MNLETVWGRSLQLAGKIWEAWGRVTGNEISRQHGFQLICVGQMRVLGGEARALLRYCTPRQALSAVEHTHPHPFRRG